MALLLAYTLYQLASYPQQNGSGLMTNTKLEKMLDHIHSAAQW